MKAFYNEIDRYCCDWLSNLMDAGLIAGGKIDDRSIEEITADDVAGYSRVHFFAGVGGWDLALQLAGWPEDRPVWTGSCPCQPFSAAGKQQGESDKRHLWPQFHRLIAAAKPAVAFGEQVASKLGRGWLAGVRADLEIMGYDVGAADLCAAGVGEKAKARIDFEDHTFRWDTVVVGAPHIRQRLWFVADTGLGELQRGGKPGELAGASSALPGEGHQREWVRNAAEHCGSNGGVADTDGGDASAEREQRSREQRRFAQDGMASVMADTADADGRRGERGEKAGAWEGRERWRRFGIGGASGFWSAFDVIPCRDGKARRVEPIAQRLADGLPAPVAPVCADIVQKIEEKINAALTESGAREAMRDLWQALIEEEVRQPTRRPDSVLSPPFLLAFMRELAKQGGTFTKSLPRTGAEIPWSGMRGMRLPSPIARPSHQRGLDGQRAAEPTDAMRILSSILARHAQSSWGEAIAENAAATFPLAHNVPARVAKLRAFGNAIVPEVAAEFIAAYMRVRGIA